ncbi:MULTISPECIES: pirin family protein [unclassified Embleya]|uniref:pirin family protein n=1 Tax=unclassified Embleya TaxID=2699296 RepID=UPI0033F3603D
MTTFDVRRAGERFHTRAGWLDSHHSFSFGRHYTPDNTHFGLLLVSNDDTVAPGTGFDTHPHRDMEILTWVLSGALVHQDSEGHNGIIHPGLAQRMSAGRGILHSERNDVDSSDPVHFVQMWVVPDEDGIAPGYQQQDVRAELARGDLVPVASGRPGHDAAIRIHQKDAALHAAHLPASGTVTLPDAPFVHVFVARGIVDLEGAGVLAAGDAVRVSDADGLRLTAFPDGPAEVLVWEMHAGLTRA